MILYKLIIYKDNIEVASIWLNCLDLALKAMYYYVKYFPRRYTFEIIEEYEEW